MLYQILFLKVGETPSSHRVDFILEVVKDTFRLKEYMAMSDLSKKREDDNRSSGMLLEPQERPSCEQIATGKPPHSQRAQALLALDKGETQAEAGRLSGLSVGQVRYWLGRFRTNRMNIFPSESPETDPDAKAMKKSKKGKASKKAKKKDKKGKKKKAKRKDKKGKKKKAKKSKKRKKKTKKK